MAQKSVFISKGTYPFFEEIGVDCTWYGGFARTQKLKCMISVHENFKRVFGNKVVEISGASPIKLGRQLSAMSLKKFVPSDGSVTTVESAFQSSRIYKDLSTGEEFGPFKDCLYLDGKESKRIVKSRSRNCHSYEYEFDGIRCPAPDFHISLFYDWVYISSLLEEHNAEVRESLLRKQYSAFTDLATSALNSQARSCAIFVSLAKANLLSEVSNFESFCKLMRVNLDNRKDYSYENSYENVQLLNKKGKYDYISTVVPNVITDEQVQQWYKDAFGNIGNKDDGKDHISLYEVFESNIIGISSLEAEDVKYGYRIFTSEGAADVLFGSLGEISLDSICTGKKVELKNHEGIWCSDEEFNNGLVYPEITADNAPAKKVLIGCANGVWSTDVFNINN